MAKNLLEQFISMFGDKLPGSYEEQEYPTYTRHSSGMTGVERYLARQTAAEQAAPALREGATGVEKYLARKALAEQEKALAEPGAPAKTGPATSVERYLAQQAAAEKATTAARQPATRVEAYLAKQANTTTQPMSKVEKYVAELASSEQGASVKKEPATGVEKYLAEQEPKDKEEAESDETATHVAKYLADHGLSAEQAPAVVEDVVEQPAPAADNAPLASETATQCQAMTGKGTQCTRAVNLTRISRSIDGRDYRFTVCSQHDSQSFKPHPAFTDN